MEAACLSNAEMMLASHVGCLRRVASINRQLAEPNGTPPGDLLAVDADGCAAEYVVARSLGLFWNALPVNVQGSADIIGDPRGIGWHVRSTPRPNGRLIIHPSDPDAGMFVLVTGRMPNLTIVGSIQCRDAKQSEWWGDPKTGRPAYWVPQAALEPW